MNNVVLTRMFPDLPRKTLNTNADMKPVAPDDKQSLFAGLRTRAAAHLFPKRAVATHSVPIISFTFDDFPRSSFLNAGPLLDQYGVKATFFGSLYMMGADTVVGKLFEIHDAQALSEGGHEVACHTFSHLSAHGHSSDFVAASCSMNRNTASSLLSGYQLRNFSYPFGDVTVSLKRRLATVYDSCRTVHNGLNVSPIDLAFLRANPIYSRLPLAQTRSLIEQNVREKGWLILYTHDVTACPSSYGCTPERFKEVLTYAASSGARLLSIRDTLTQFQTFDQHAAETQTFDSDERKEHHA